MPVYLCRTEFTTLSPLLDNPSVDLVYLQSSSGSGVASDLAMGLANAWRTPGPSAVHDPTAYLAASISRASNSATVTVYDITTVLDGTAHGSPVAIVAFNPDAPVNNNSYPEGVAAVVSWRSPYGTAVEFGPVSAIPTPSDIQTDYGASATHQGRTRPRSRLRNRFYWGPLNSGAFAIESVTNRCVLSSGFLSDMTKWMSGQGAEIIKSGTPPTNWDLQTWSRRNATTANAFTTHMDDAPDYQRRRRDPSTVITTATWVPGSLT